MTTTQTLGAVVLSGLLGCGGGAFLTTIQSLDDGLGARGQRLSQAWIEMRVPEGGLSRELNILAGQCVTAIAVTNEQDFVFVEALERRGPSFNGGSWLITCSPDADANVDLRLIAAAGTPVAFGTYVGPDNSSHGILAEYFTGGTAPSVPVTDHADLEVAESVSPPTSDPEVTPAASGDPNGEGADPNGQAIATGTGPGACSQEVARAAYREGMEAMRNGRLAMAVTSLNRAYECQPDGTILFNLAAATARQGKHVAARQMYQNLLRDFPSLPDTRRTQVQQAIAQLDRPGGVHVRIQRGDRVFVNGVLISEVRRGRTRARVTAGSHHVEIRARDGSRFQTDVNVIAGERVEVDPRRVPE